MPTQHHIEEHLADMSRITQDVFQTMLGVDTAIRTEAPQEGGVYAQIRFVGEWRGELAIHCSLRDAIQTSRRMLPGVSPSCFDEDVRDAMGELANVIAGNLKATLPPGVSISIPCVGECAESDPACERRAINAQNEIGLYQVALSIFPED